MRLSELKLIEAPLADISYHKGEESGLSARDWKVITKYMKDHTYFEKLKAIPFKLYVYIIDDKYTAKFGDNFPDTQITDSDIKKGFTQMSDDTALGLDKGILKEILGRVIENRKDDPSGVHFIMGDNYTGEDTVQVAPTPWMLIHRLAHCFIADEDFRRSRGGVSHLGTTIREAEFTRTKGSPHSYGEDSKNKYFTFRSARTNNVTGGEWKEEVITQFFVTGDIKINQEYSTHEIEQSVKELKDDLSKYAQTLKGKIFYI